MKFQKLTPNDNVENISQYEEALDFALNEKDIKNIAITGIYGAGKSSVFETYKKKSTSKSIKKHEFIHISLANYEDAESILDGKKEDKTNDNIGDKKIDNKTLEGKILNQLLHQIKPNNIPQSIFKLKTNISDKQIQNPSFFIMAFIITLFLLFNLERGSGLWYYLVFICLILTFGLVYRLVELQLNKQILRSFSIRSSNIQSEIEVFKESDESYFDKYLDDVIYLFYNSNAKVIVFEDIDRFDNNIIFAELKEINTLVNHRKDINSEAKITFLYMLKDNMFLSKDRTKFFDFIIPVIPVINSSNSYDILKKSLEVQPTLVKSNGITLFNMFDNIFLLKISIYLDDLRLLKNIINEFLIYYNRLYELDLNVNKLFSMIVYKNVFPDDFANFQLNNGFLHQIFKNKRHYIFNKNLEIDNKINELEEQKIEAKNEKLNSKYELYALYFKGVKDFDELMINNNSEREYTTRSLFIKDIIKSEYKIKGRKRYNNSFVPVDVSESFKMIDENPEFNKRLEIIKDKNEINEIDTKIKQLKDKKTKGLANAKLQDVVDRLDIENIESRHFTGDTNEFESVKNNPYFDLLVFLIINGHIDEDYPNYITYFHKSSLSVRDKEFLRGLHSGRRLDYAYPLNELQEVYNRLEISDFYKEGILNINLFKYILLKVKTNNSIQNKDIRSLENYYNLINDSNRLGFFIDIYKLESIEVREFMLSRLLHVTPTMLIKIIQNDIISKNNKNIIIIDLLNHFSSNDFTIDKDSKDLIKDYINRNESILYKNENPSIKYNDLFKENLKALNIKFHKIDFFRIADELEDTIYDENLYCINFNNIATLLGFYYNTTGIDVIHKNYSIINELKNEPINKYIMNNIEIYIENYINFTRGKILDDNKHIYSILNNETISIDLRIEYIKGLENQKLFLNELTVADFNNVLIKNNNIEINSENIISYYVFEGSRWTEELIEFVKTNRNHLKFNWDDIDESVTNIETEQKYNFFLSTVLENRLDNVAYEKILKEVDYIYEENLSKQNIEPDKFKILINHNIIEFNGDTLKDQRLNYQEILMYFISVNLDLYLKLMEDRLFYEYDELLNVLKYHEKSKVDIKKKIIKAIKEPVSIKSISYDNENIIKFILENNFDKGDLQYIINNYNEFGQLIRQEIEKLVITYLEDISSNNIELSKTLVENIVRNDSIMIEMKQLLFSRNINLFYREELKEIFSILELKNFIEVVNKYRKNMPFEKNEINRNIIIFLNKKDLISSYKEHEYYYHVNSYKEKNLI